MASWDILGQFIDLKFDFGFVLKSSKYTLAFKFENLPDLQSAFKSNSSYIYIHSDETINTGTAHLKIYEVFKGIIDRLYESPISIVRTNSCLADKKKCWFSSDNPDVNHEYLKCLKIAPKHFLEWLNLPLEWCNYFVYEGLKNIGCDKFLEPSSLYAIALISSVQEANCPLRISDRNNIPKVDNFKYLNKSKITIETCDFAMSLFEFFKDFFTDKPGELRDVEIEYNYVENYLLLRSQQNVMKLFDCIQNHLNNWSDKNTANLGSHYLAKCIYYGEWGLIGNGNRFKDGNGLFDISFVEKEVKFLWKI